MSDEPENHREIDERSPRPEGPSARTTKAFSCTCAAHQQMNCAYWRMGYCSDKWHGSTTPTPRSRPKLVVDNGNVYQLRTK